MKEKILLLDTSFSAKPIYDFLLKTGNEVYVMGGNPDDFLAKYSEKYINLNYSKVDQVKDLIKSLKINYLVPGGNDFSYKICSELNEIFDFYNIDSCKTNEIINNKEKFRIFSTDINLHVPKIINLEQVKKYLPVIIKPVDAYSGHGMTVIYENDTEKINTAIKYAEKYSKSQRCIIEEFVQGQLFSHSAFITDGEIINDFIVEEHCSANQYVVDSSFVTHKLDKTMLETIRTDITLLAKELNLCDGLIHTQFIAKDDKFWLIEVTRRCPGDLYSQLIEFSTEFPYAEYYAKPFINWKNRPTDKEIKKLNILRHTVSLPKEGFFNSLVFNYPLSIYKYIPLALPGDIIKASPFGRIGLLFSISNTESELKEILDKAINRKLYSVDK